MYMRKHIFSLLLAVCMVFPMSMMAWDSEPDGNGLYDGLYDRPTYFQDWMQPSAWPNCMFCFCDVQKDGVRVESYEIAVYDQHDALRCCDRSLAKQDHYCVLTICGEEGDTFHFRVFYGADFAHPLVSDVQGVTVPFETNGKVGSADPLEPFVLTIQEGTPTGLEEVTGYGLPVTGKIIRNGQLFILRDGKTYSVTGAEVNSRK